MVNGPDDVKVRLDNCSNMANYRRVSLPNNIRTARERRKMKQAELARRIDCVRSAVCEWEKGVREPSLQQLRDIAAVLEVDIRKLVA
jgi:transcriptional regulator with XRE-family HTH domain